MLFFELSLNVAVYMSSICTIYYVDGETFGMLHGLTT
jgi:hypothetical protein